MSRTGRPAPSWLHGPDDRRDRVHRIGGAHHQVQLRVRSHAVGHPDLRRSGLSQASRLDVRHDANDLGPLRHVDRLHDQAGAGRWPIRPATIRREALVDDHYGLTVVGAREVTPGDQRDAERLEVAG